MDQELELTPAKPTKAVASAEAIKLLPEVVQAAAWNDRKRLRAACERVAEALGDHYPAVGKRLVQSIPGEMKALPMPDHLLAFCSPRFGLESVFLAPEVLADCVALCDEQKQRERLARFALDPRHTILLEGPPGNGKTTLAEALARELDLPYLFVKYSGLVASHLGETGTNLQKIFDYAATAPCLLFLDEFDGIGRSRSEKGDLGEMKRVTNQLLILLDGMPATTVFVAATNLIGQIDDALYRRFDTRLTIAAPSPELKERCARHELRAEITPGWDDIGDFAALIASSDKVENLHEVVKICRRVRRDLVLNDGRNLGSMAKSLEGAVI